MLKPLIDRHAPSVHKGAVIALLVTVNASSLGLTFVDSVRTSKFDFKEKCLRADLAEAYSELLGRTAFFWKSQRRWAAQNRLPGIDWLTLVQCCYHAWNHSPASMLQGSRYFTFQVRAWNTDTSYRASPCLA
jgi:hypothetical protein